MVLFEGLHFTAAPNHLSTKQTMFWNLLDGFILALERGLSNESQIGPNRTSTSTTEELDNAV